MHTKFAIVALGLLLAMQFPAAAQTKDEAAKGTNVDTVAPAIYPRPSDFHTKMFKVESGVWDATMKCYFAGPNQPPQEFKATNRVREAVDRLFILSDFESDFVGGKKYKGQGIWGYDVRNKKVVGAWVDNLGTSVIALEGEYDPKTDTLTAWAERVDHLTGQRRKEKHVTEYKGEGRKIWTMYSTVLGGGDQMVKVLEAEWTRRNGSAETKTAAK